MSDILTPTHTADDLRPDNEILMEAALRTLKGRVSEDEARSFLKQASSAGVPAPIGATASLNITIWGKLQCDPDGQPWKYDITVWGGPAYFGTSVGFLYTAYTSWDAFFRNTTAAHAQGIASGGGILQINWFNGDGVPVGQFNGAAGAIGLVEAGGKGGWERK